jgi:flagellar biogenesis protein FliO
MRILLVLALVLGLAAGAVANPPAAPTLPAEGGMGGSSVLRPPVIDATASTAVRVQDDAPSLGAAVLRLLGSVVLVALLLVAAVVGYRSLVRHSAARPGGMLGWMARAAEDRDPDLVRIGSRRYLGARDSVAVVHAGGERFLVGISAAGITLISRLESSATEVEPSPATFGEALERAANPAPVSEVAPMAERALRAALERSRTRLARLGAPEDPRA